MTGEQAMKQATETAHYYLIHAVRLIDQEFGYGYARDNPVVVGAFVQACAQDYQTAVRAGLVDGLSRG